MTMVFVMNLLLAFVLTRNVNCEENTGGRENRERGRSLRHITEYVREVEGVEGDGDLGVSRAYQATPDEEEAKEEASLGSCNGFVDLSESTLTVNSSNWT